MRHKIVRLFKRIFEITGIVFLFWAFLGFGFLSMMVILDHFKKSLDNPLMVTSVFCFLAIVFYVSVLLIRCVIDKRIEKYERRQLPVLQCSLIEDANLYEDVNEIKKRAIILLNGKLLALCSKEEIQKELCRLLDDSVVKNSDFRMRIISLKRALRVHEKGQKTPLSSSRLTVYSLGEVGLKLCTDEDLVEEWENLFQKNIMSEDQDKFYDAIERELYRRGIIS